MYNNNNNNNIIIIYNVYALLCYACWLDFYLSSFWLPGSFNFTHTPTPSTPPNLSVGMMISMSWTTNQNLTYDLMIFFPPKPLHWYNDKYVMNNESESYLCFDEFLFRPDIISSIMKNFNRRDSFPWSPWLKAPRTGATRTLTWIARILSRTYINTVTTWLPQLTGR